MADVPDRGQYVDNALDASSELYRGKQFLAIRGIESSLAHRSLLCTPGTWSVGQWTILLAGLRGRERQLIGRLWPSAKFSRSMGRYSRCLQRSRSEFILKSEIGFHIPELRVGATGIDFREHSLAPARAYWPVSVLPSDAKTVPYREIRADIPHIGQVAGAGTRLTYIAKRIVLIRATA